MKNTYREYCQYCDKRYPYRATGQVLALKRFPTFVLAGLLLALAANLAGAVGLGVLEVESDPGDPLRARVPLMDLGDVRPTELDIALASVADYQQANATRYEILSSIRLHIETGPDGAWVVLTTEQPISASSSTVILDTTWPGGRILSQHLLRIGASPPPELVPAAPSGEPSAGGELAEAGRQTIRTVSGDSLWRIAERLAGENPENLNQTMLALHRLNPESFIDGDIDRLRADAELRVPDLSELGALDQVSAQDESARQPVAGNTQPQPLAAPAPQPADQDDQPDGQLSLVVQEGGDDVQGGVDELDARIAELENQLALAQEEADRVRIEQEELRARLDDLDDQIAMARQIIELQERELAQLQASLAAQAAEQARQEAEQAAAAEAAATAAEAAAAAEARAAAEFPRSLLGNPLLLAVAAAILVLALVLVLMKRGGRGDEEDEREEAFIVIGSEDAPDVDQAEDEPDAAEESPTPEETLDEAPDETPKVTNADDSGDDELTVDLDGAEEEEVAEQLNLAYSFHKMGETAKARGILENVIRSGNDGQISEARQLLAIIDDMS